MRSNLFQNKQIVYWGTGMIAQMLIDRRKDITPSFYISSFEDETEFLQKKVYHPNEIANWNDYVIVIATLQINEVEKQLKERGLVKDENYLYYYELIVEKTYDDLLHDVQKLNVDNQSPTLFVIPIGRRTSQVKGFYAAYKEGHKNERCVALYILNGNMSYEDIGFEMIECPRLFSWEGNSKISEMEHIDAQNFLENSLSSKEREYVKQIEEFFYSKEKLLALNTTAYQYEKLKMIVDLLNPQKVIMWADSYRGNKILECIFKEKEIPFCYLEFGWLPGTIQVDKKGIGGRSEYVSGDSKLKEVPKEKLKDYNISAIINDIINNKRDTGRFKVTEKDKNVFNSLNPQKKCIFFPGLGGQNHIFNSKSDLWKKEISALFESSHDALLYLAKVCKDNDWQILYKPHPGLPSDYDAVVDGYSDIIFEVKDMEIDQILNRCDAVVACFHSAIEFKTLMYKKPLVNLGYSMMSIADCSYKAKDRVDIEHCVRQALEVGFTESQEKNFEMFVAQLLETCLWDDQTDRNLRYGLDIKNKDIWE